MNDPLSLYLLPPVLSLICALYLVALVVARGVHDTGRLLFVLVCVWYSLLAPVFICHHLVADPEALLAIERGVHFFYVYLPVVMVAYFHHILDIRRKDILGVLFVISFIFSLTTQGELYITGLYSYNWGYIAKGGVAFQLFGLYGLAVMAYCVRRFVRRLKVETNAALRLKFKYVLLSFGLAVFLTFLNVPAMHGVDIYPPGNFSFLPMAILAYGMLKHRLVEIGSLMHMTLIRVILFLMVLLPNLFLFDWAEAFFADRSSEARIVGLGLWFTLNYFYVQQLRKITGRIMQKSHHHFQRVETRLARKMLVLRNADDLVRKTGAALRAVLPFAWVHIHMYDEIKGELIGSDGTNRLLPESLIAAMSRHKGIIEQPFLERMPTFAGLLEPMAQLMADLKADYIVAVFHQNSFMGLLAMPKKLNGRALTPDEAAFIKNITSTLALALSNAMTYQQVSALKDRLQSRNDALNREIAERERAQQRLKALQDELQHANDELEHAILQANEMTAKAEIANYVLTREVEDRKRMEEMLRQSEERYRLVTENATDVIWCTDMAGRFTFMSPSVRHLLGYTPEEMMALDTSRVLTPESFKVAADAIEKELTLLHRPASGKLSTSRTTELEQVRKDGTTVWTEVNTRFLKDDNLEVMGILGVSRDISARKKTEEELIYLAHHDVLTGLYNRKAFGELLDKEVKYARRYRSGLALMLLDLNKFKTVNDTYGHEIGDRFLISMADRLKGAVRETDHVARLGGDEFTIILVNPEEVAPDTVARRIVRDLADPLEYEGASIDFVTASIGIATYPRDGRTVGALMKSADMAMYEAKKRTAPWLHHSECMRKAV